MLGYTVDALAVANWQRSGSKGRPPRVGKWPWSPRSEDVATFGTAAPVTDIRDYLILRNGRAPDLEVDVGR